MFVFGPAGVGFARRGGVRRSASPMAQRVHRGRLLLLLPRDGNVARTRKKNKKSWRRCGQCYTMSDVRNRHRRLQRLQPGCHSAPWDHLYCSPNTNMSQETESVSVFFFFFFFLQVIVKRLKLLNFYFFSLPFWLSLNSCCFVLIFAIWDFFFVSL